RRPARRDPRHPDRTGRRGQPRGDARRAVRRRRGLCLRHRRRSRADRPHRGSRVWRQPGEPRAGGAVRARGARPRGGLPPLADRRLMDVAVASAMQPVPAAVGAADVLAAQARLRRYLEPTPLHYAERFGCWLKLENLQRTGSYKVRGALNALLAGRERGDERPVIAASAGNHAQGRAWAAYRLSVPAITVMPKGAPETKVAGVAHWGATVRLHGDSYDEAKAFAAELA